MAAANVTTDPEQIRKWVEARGGRPARVKRTGRGEDPGILRIDYPGFTGEGTLETISWDKWFDAFEKDKLAFLYDDKPNSRFSKIVARAKSATPRRAGAAKRTTSKRATGTRVAAKRKSRPGKVTSIGAKKTGAKKAGAKKTATSRKAPRAMAARMGKRPAATKKRTATKKRASGGASGGASRAQGTGGGRASSGKKRSSSKRSGAGAKR